MAGIMNNTARQFNVRVMDKSSKKKITIRLKPGFNVVEDNIWNIARTCDFVKELDKSNSIVFGNIALNDREISAEKSEIAMIKQAQAPKTNKL